MKNKVLREPAEVADRLAQLGLSAEPLRQAVAMGEASRNSCTANDPVIAPGFLAWARTTRGLRDELAPDWERCSDGGLETVVSPDGSMAIAVATGDEATGRRDSTPKTKYARGPSTVAAVEQNQLSMLHVLFNTAEPIVPGPPPTRRVTYLLLIAARNGEVRCELSLPETIGEDGRVESWAERIILDPVPSDGTPMTDTGPVDPGPDIVVEVSRRVR